MYTLEVCCFLHKCQETETRKAILLNTVCTDSGLLVLKSVCYSPATCTLCKMQSCGLWMCLFFYFRTVFIVFCSTVLILLVFAVTFVAESQKVVLLCVFLDTALPYVQWCNKTFNLFHLIASFKLLLKIITLLGFINMKFNGERQE